jgi:hypothetical protein
MLTFWQNIKPTRATLNMPFTQPVKFDSRQVESYKPSITSTSSAWSSLFPLFRLPPSHFVWAADPAHNHIKQKIMVSGAIPASEREVLPNQVASLVQDAQQISDYHAHYINLVLESPGIDLRVFADAEAYTPNTPTGMKGFYMPALNMLGINRDYLKYESAANPVVSSYLLAEEFFHALVCLSNTAYDPISASKLDKNIPRTCAAPYTTLKERNELKEILQNSFNIVKDYERLQHKDAASYNSAELEQLKRYQKAIEHYVPRIRTAGIISTKDKAMRQVVLQQLAAKNYQAKNYIKTNTQQKIFYIDQVKIDNSVLARGYLVEDPNDKIRAFIEDTIFDNYRTTTDLPADVTAQDNWLIEIHASVSTNHPELLDTFYPGLRAYNEKIINRVRQAAEEINEVIYETMQPSYY